MQKHADFAEFTEITPSAAIDSARHGWRAKCLQRLIRIDLPVPRTVVLPCDTVRLIATGQMPDTARLAAVFAGALVSIRPSPANPDWGGPGTVLNVGMNAAKHAELLRDHGAAHANALYLGFVQSYAIHVARLDPDMFTAEPSSEALAAALAAYEAEMDEAFPQSPAKQIGEVLRSMARAWEGTTARLLREAKGAPSDAALGLIVQEMAQAVGPGLSGSGTIQLVEGVTGAPQVTGRFRGLNPANRKAEETLYLVKDKRGHSLEEAAPEVFAALQDQCRSCRQKLREEMLIEFALENGALKVIDAVKMQRSSRAAVRIAVTL
ncbi:MAG: pyruvate, phosphate dikinase, partial [Rhodobacteraceae bacterium]|nr:pyruvate, phosphate dikinase [Paracoccaceae bacterium]